jgi:4-hydroxybenzoyl-CoA thioesterase
VTSFTFRKQLTIAWGHCDPAGIVFNPRFFEMFDANTWQLFEAALGVKPENLNSTYGIIGIALVDARANFLKPAKFGDTVEIASRVSEFRRSSFDVEHRLTVGGELAVEGQETRVWAMRRADDPDMFLQVQQRLADQGHVVVVAAGRDAAQRRDPDLRRGVLQPLPGQVQRPPAVHPDQAGHRLLAGLRVGRPGHGLPQEGLLLGGQQGDGLDGRLPGPLPVALDGLLEEGNRPVQLLLASRLGRCGADLVEGIPETLNNGLLHGAAGKYRDGRKRCGPHVRVLVAQGFQQLATFVATLYRDVVGQVATGNTLCEANSLTQWPGDGTTDPCGKADGDEHAQGAQPEQQLS